MAQVTIKAHDGLRSKNLRGIAKSLERILRLGNGEYVTSSGEDTAGGAILNERQVRRLNGYVEQLRIIANEVASTEELMRKF